MLEHLVPCWGWLALTLLTPLVWVTGAVRFRSSCLGKPGWLGVLMRYHFYGLLMCGLVILVMPGVPWVVYRAGRLLTGSEEVSSLLGIVAFFAGTLTTIFVVGGWVRRRVKMDMDPLQREVAVDLARERLRRELRHQRRGGIFDGQRRRG